MVTYRTSKHSSMVEDDFPARLSNEPSRERRGYGSILHGGREEREDVAAEDGHGGGACGGRYVSVEPGDGRERR